MSMSKILTEWSDGDEKALQDAANKYFKLKSRKENIERLRQASSEVKYSDSGNSKLKARFTRW